MIRFFFYGCLPLENALLLLSLSKMLYGLSFDKCSSVSHDLLVCLPHNFFLNLFYFYPVYIFFIIFFYTSFWATKLKKRRKMSGIDTGIEYLFMITKRHICNINSIRFCALDCHTNRKDYPWCKKWNSFSMVCTLISYRKKYQTFPEKVIHCIYIECCVSFSLWNIHIAFAFIM